MFLYASGSTRASKGWAEPRDDAATCHECGGPADDECVHCQQATCAGHFHEREHLGLCTHCGAEIEALVGAEG